LSVITVSCQYRRELMMARVFQLILPIEPTGQEELPVKLGNVIHMAIS
jgi:hypothetical protein